MVKNSSFFLSLFRRHITDKLVKEKIAIVGLWFLVLTAVRFLLAFALRDIWIGTFGAVAFTFLIFYFIMKHTPMQRYASAINKVLSEWYQRRYFFISTILTSTILMSLLILIQYGYLYYGNRLVMLNVFGSDDRELARMLRPIENYPLLDKVAITIASTDKSLDGNYSKTTSYLLAEDLEMIAFVLVVRKKKNLFSQ